MPLLLLLFAALAVPAFVQRQNPWRIRIERVPPDPDPDAVATDIGDEPAPVEEPTPTSTE